MITITSLPYHPKWNVWRYPTTLTDFGDLTTCTGRHPRHHLTQWDFFFWPAHFSKDLGTRKIWKQETHAQEMLGDVKVPRLQASITYVASSHANLLEQIYPRIFRVFTDILTRFHPRTWSGAKESVCIRGEFNSKRRWFHVQADVVCQFTCYQ